MENTNLNIPTATVNDVINIFTAIYADVVNDRTALRSLPTPFLWGAPGVGKSEGVRQFAKELSRRTGKRVIVTDIRLLLFSPVDLRGVPVADKNRELTSWLQPRIFHLDEAEDCINILFLDELSAAPQSVQACAYQICLDRCVGEHRLPDNCIVIAAGNRTTDKSVAFKMPKALANRLIHFQIVPSYAQWKQWALNSGLDERIIGYLGFDNSMLCTQPENSDLAYPTPRSWSFVSSLIAPYKDDLSGAHMLIAGCIGADTALSFEEWCRAYRDLPRVEDILEGRCRTYPKRQDALYALSASLTTALYRMQESATDAQLDHVCAYAGLFPPDFAVSFFDDLNRNDKLRLRLMNCRPFNVWLHKNRHVV